MNRLVAQLLVELWPNTRVELVEVEHAGSGPVVRVRSPAGASDVQLFADAQRCRVAVAWHRLALQVKGHPAVRVPRLQSTRDGWIVQEAPRGTALRRWLAQLGRDYVESWWNSELEAVVKWLATFHELEMASREALIQLSAQGKEQLIAQRYDPVLKEIPLHLKVPAAEFIQRYLATDGEPVQGGLDASTVCLGRECSIHSFEHGHFGEGGTDLAALLADFVVRVLELGGDPAPVIESAWDEYGAARSRLSLSAMARFRIHLAFHVLWRMGSLDGDSKSRAWLWGSHQLAMFLNPVRR